MILSGSLKTTKPLMLLRGRSEANADAPWRHFLAESRSKSPLGHHQRSREEPGRYSRRELDDLAQRQRSILHHQTQRAPLGNAHHMRGLRPGAARLATRAAKREE